MTEAELLAAILELARLRGWRTAHFCPARTARGWRTAVAGDGEGFPDLVICPRRGMPPLPGRLPPRQPEFWELKAPGRRLQSEQRVWRDLLLCTGAVWRLVTPADWTSGRVAEWLT